MKRTTSLSLLFFALFFFLFSNAYAGFTLGISPVRWEAAGKPGKTLRNVITVTGGARAIQRVRLKVGDWMLTNEGTPVFAGAGSMPHSAASWIRFRPREFDVYPRQKKLVRVSIKIPEGTPPGTYLAALFFEPPATTEGAKPGAANIFIRGRIAFLIYVTVGNARPDGKILDVAWREMTKGKGPVVALKIRNDGDAHLRTNGTFSARSPSGKRYEGVLPALPILPGQTRWIPLEFAGEAPPAGSNIDITVHTDLGRGELKVELKLHGNKEG